jgi:hypothetical protein
VTPLAAAGATTEDAGRSRGRPELLVLDAGCALNAGRQRDAAERFAALVKEYPEAARAREAAYYRFRALDVARTADPGLTPAYEEALTAYLARWERAEGGAEARFLLAELHRGRGDCKRAEAEYVRVSAGPFAARARLGALECRTGDLASAGAKAAPERRAEVLAALRAFARETPDKGLAARATLLGALVAAGASPPDHAAVVELLDGFEVRHPDARDLHARARELRLVARVASGQVEAARADLEAFLAAPAGDGSRRQVLARLGRELATRAERAPAAEARAPLDLARRVQAALVEGSKDPRDRIVLADLELRSGDAAAARRDYEQVLASDGSSAEALRGAARAAAAAGDRDAALAYWRRVADGSAPGGTAWYEARLAQVDLLAGGGQRTEACSLLRGSRGRATSAGGDQLDARLRSLEPEVCR